MPGGGDRGDASFGVAPLILLGIGTRSGKMRLPLAGSPPITDRASGLEKGRCDYCDWKASMKKMPVITAVVLTLTMLLLAPLEANAGGRGGGVEAVCVSEAVFLASMFLFLAAIF